MPRRHGTIEHHVAGQSFGVLIYCRTPRHLLEPPAKELADRTLGPGSVSFLPAGMETHWLYETPLREHDRYLHVLHLRFTPDFIGTLGFNRGDINIAPALNMEIAGLARQMELALSAYEGGGIYQTIALQTAGLAAAERFLNPKKTSSRSTATLTQRRLGALEDYVDRSAAGEVSLLGMADAVGLSPSHFLRVFKATIGQSPRAWAAKRRLTTNE